jgi:osmotically-inducible protein OsmY
MNGRKKSPAALATAVLIPVLVFIQAGCQRRDADRLAAFGTKLGQKTEGLFSPAGSRGLRGLNTNAWRIGEGTIEARVSARLEGDKSLAESSIQVQCTGGVVELNGKVRDVDQKRRAYELAQTTQGVEKVLDRLEISP